MNLKPLLFLLLILTIPTATATITESYSWGDKIIYVDGTFEINQHGNNYQTWEGVWEQKDLMEVGTTHYPYLIIDGGTQWTLTKNGEFLTLPKNTIYSYSFNPYHIGMTITATPTHLNSISTYHNVAGNDTWYIIIPNQIVNNIKVFNWDNKIPHVSNQSGIFLNQTNFEYHKVGDEIRFYYNQEARDFGIESSEIVFEFKSWYVVGEGGSGFSGNVTFENTTIDFGDNYAKIGNGILDNFNDLDPNAWTSIGGTWDTSNGYLRRTSGATHDKFHTTFESNISNSVEHWFSFTFRNVTPMTTGAHYIKFNTDNPTADITTIGGAALFIDDNEYKILNMYTGATRLDASASIGNITDGQNHTIMVRFDGGDNFELYTDGVSEGISLYITMNANNTGLQIHSSITYAAYDDIRYWTSSNGNITQNIYDSGAGNEIQKIGNNGTFADGTVSVDLQINSSDDDFSTSTGWYTVQSNVTTGTMYDVPAGYKKRYYQVRSVLSTTNTSQTPIIENIRSLIGAAEADNPPTIELLSQTPSVLYQNSTGTFNLTYGITHSTAGLNNTSISFVNTMWDIVNDHYNLSIRSPNNDKAAYSVHFGEYILRGNNRNETLNFENNVTITEGNIWKWSGMDENNTELTIEVINSTYTKVHINTLIHDHVFSNMWYLDRSTMQEAPKTQYSIYKDNGALIKFWDAEAAAGHVHLGCAHFDTGLGAVEPTPANPIEIWYANKSYNPLGSVAVEDSPYAFYMTSLTKDEWVNYTYTPHANSSYARCITINSTDIENAGINVTDIAYLYLTSQTNNNRPFYLNMTNMSSGTNVSFADTNVMWSGTAPFTQVNYTPNMFITMIHDNYQYQAKLYTADNDDLWGNSTLHTSNVEVSIFPPTKPSIHYILYNGVEYQNSAIDNKTFNGIVDVAVAVSTDPDGGVVTHNLTLHYRNETLVAIINNTFTEPTNAFAEIEFNTTTYYSYTDEYTLRVIATDDEGDNQTAWLGHNFTLYVTDEPTNLQNTTGNHWVNFTWDPGANTDAYNVTFNGTWYNSTNTSINHSVGAHGWGNITVWAWNDSSGMSTGSISDNVQVPNNAPVLTGVPDSNTNEDVPINDAFDLDTYYSDVDGDSPSYSVYSNNQTGNITPSIDGNNVVSYALAANWYGVAEIVYKVEDGYGANDTDTVLVIVSSVNDAPNLTPIGSKTINENQILNIDVDATDIEGDPLTYLCNRTDLFTNFNTTTGIGSWTPTYAQSGIYHVRFGANDSVLSTTEIVTITVNDIPLTITSYWNNITESSLSASIYVNDSIAFGVTTNRTSNITWYKHGVFAETDTDTTQGNYTILWNSVGIYKINASATDGFDTTLNTTFTVTVSMPEYNISGYVIDGGGVALSGATVSDNKSIDSTTTNTSGYYWLSGYINGSYLIGALKTDYTTNSTSTVISGADQTNINITLIYSPPPPVEEERRSSSSGLITPPPTPENVTVLVEEPEALYVINVSGVWSAVFEKPPIEKVVTAEQKQFWTILLCLSFGIFISGIFDKTPKIKAQPAIALGLFGIIVSGFYLGIANIISLQYIENILLNIGVKNMTSQSEMKPFWTFILIMFVALFISGVADKNPKMKAQPAIAFGLVGVLLSVFQLGLVAVTI